MFKKLVNTSMSVGVSLASLPWQVNYALSNVLVLALMILPIVNPGTILPYINSVIAITIFASYLMSYLEGGKDEIPKFIFMFLGAILGVVFSSMMLFGLGSLFSYFSIIVSSICLLGLFSDLSENKHKSNKEKNKVIQKMKESNFTKQKSTVAETKENKSPKKESYMDFL